MQVSVVVPVYNAGELIDRYAPALLEQSIGAAAYEVIYVNNGSTDDSEERLAGITARYPHARHLSQPSSGGPGKPRNIGIEAAQGDYIQFVDQDDELTPEALQRMSALGSANAADIVLGKLGGAMAEPNPVFRRTVASGTLDDVPAIEALTGHRMFRREFLNEHQIRFPEGYWRMENLLFLARAYAHDPRLSVVADYTCYLWHVRDHSGNTIIAPFDIEDHYWRLRVIIATLRDQVPPGERRDRLLRRLYRMETMSRVAERHILDPRRIDWYEAFEPLRAVARECFPPSVRAGLPPIQRLRGELVEAGEQRATYELARRIATLRPVIERRRLRITADAALRVDLTVRLAFADGRAFELTVESDGWSLDRGLTDGLPGMDPYLIDDPLREAQGQLQLEDVGRQEWWYPEGELVPALRELDPGWVQPILAGELVVDPAKAAAGYPLAPGRYAVWFNGQLLGVNRRRRLVAPASVQAKPARWHVSASGPVVARLDWSGPGAKLHLLVQDRQEWLADNLMADPSAPEPDSLLDHPVRLDGRLPATSVPVILSIADQPVFAELTGGNKGGRGLLRLPADDAPGPAGRYPVFVAGGCRVLGEAQVGDGRMSWVVNEPEPRRQTDPPGSPGSEDPAGSARLRQLALQVRRRLRPLTPRPQGPGQSRGDTPRAPRSG